MRFFLAGICAVFISCAGPYDDGGSVGSVTAETEFANKLTTIPRKQGFAGYFDVPEMLCLSVQDSAPAALVARRVELAYSALEQDIASTGALLNGPYGQITYNNDTSNFKFECFALIRRIPKKNPSIASVVVMEADHMLAYNYFGPYNLLYTGYAAIRELITDKNLVQSGPMREYYMTDPRKQPDENKLRTLILVPVRQNKALE